jgi:tRNA(Arg) A34 adenosine deaminase TadA
MFEELDLHSPRKTDAEKMQLAVELARRNVRHGGGPFGAIVFDADTGLVVAPGANMVVGQACSLLHAEILAITFAQARVQSFTLDSGNHELVTSSEPCVQCLGAIYWAGLRRVVCGATVAQAIAAGFDEGPRSELWKEELASRGIQVADQVLAEHAASVFAEYARRGGLVYNARSRDRV